MRNLQIHNAPFDVNFSSCSTLVPNSFRWKHHENNELPVVYCDDSIFGGMEDPNPEKYAWIVESPELTKNVVAFIRNNKSLVSSTYKKLFTCIESLVGLEKNFVYCPSGSNLPWIKTREIFEKTKACSMFASRKRYTSGHYMRDYYAKKFANSLDLYGGTNNSKVIGSGIHPDKSEGMNPYMFSVVIENCMEDKYYTEKVTDCFATGTVPIYWGTRKICEDFDQRGIIFLDSSFDITSLNRDLYMSKMEYIRSNFEIVNGLKMADDYLMERIV